MSDQPNTERPLGLRAALADWMRPPRAHGQVIEDRAVSFLELFYDLVFVVLVAQIAHTLADHIGWVGVRDFVVVFVLIWFAWLNGSLYHELHGGEDGRSRSYIFGQMGLLAVLAVYAGHAAAGEADGRGFAIVYTLLLLVLAWQWWRVRREDTPEFAAVSAGYLASLLVMVVAMAASAAVADPEVRVWVWLGAIVVTFAGMLRQLLRRDPELVDAMRVTDSMAERFGLFTIIVLGEVVVGVVDGLAELDEGRPARTVVTAILALTIGFGFWWNYFDFAGRRVPRPSPTARTVWMLAHLPIALSVAATGAGMVGLVEHASDARTPGPTAWLITGATAALAVSLAVVVWTMDAHPGRAMVPRTLTVAAALALAAGAARPAPWLLALILFALLSAVWIEAFVRHARSGLPIAEG